MTSKRLLLLLIFFLGLVGCTPDTKPKDLSYEEAINYIKNNSKGEATPLEGWLHYNCKDLEAPDITSTLIYLGADNPVTKSSDRKELSSSTISKYIEESGDKAKLANAFLPLMYLTESNFKIFVKDDDTFSYQLTHLKEFIMTNSDIDDTSYTRYYNSSLRLTRFEIHNSDTSTGYDILQTYLYN